MCGIFGSFDRRLDSRAVACALVAMKNRGPDGARSMEISPGRVFGHTRLAIVDLDARADQPMTGVNGCLTLVFNGEIYNAPELRAAIPDYPWMTDHSDTEVILAAYWRWGEDFVHRLRGMFALALWDAREEVLFLAVDRFSIKPLCIFQDGAGLAFASTVGALASLGCPVSPNERAVHSWLADGVLGTGTETFFADVVQLPAATLATWRDGELAMQRYWEPPLPEPEEVPLGEIEAWLDEAVAAHLISDVPVGINLSSGLDSNVLRLRARAMGKPLHAFTFSFPGTHYDEAVRVRSIVADDDEWTTTPISAEDLWRNLISVTRQMEMPLGGVAIYGHACNAATARAAGYKVLLAGEGADETLAGYKYYAEAAIASLWRTGKRDEAVAMFAAFAARDAAGWCTSPEHLAQQSDRADVARAPDGTVLNESFLSAKFAETEKLPSVPAVLGEPVRAAMWSDLTCKKLPKLLRWQDRAYMASGIEIRVPFLDHKLVESLQGLPVSQLISEGHTKAPLREIAERLLPSGYFRQPKLYVATPQREWLKDDLRTNVEDWLDPGAALVRRGYVDLDRLRVAYRAYCDDDELGNSFFIWKFIALEALFQGVIEGQMA